MKKTLPIILIAIIGTIFAFSDANSRTKESNITAQTRQTSDYEKVINTIVPSKYNYASFLGDNFILVSDSKLYGAIDLLKKIILPLKYKSVIYSRQHKVFMVAKEDTSGELLWGFIGTDGRIRVPIIYSSIINISNSRSEPTAIVIKNSKYGYLNFVTGKVSIEPDYDFLGTDSLLIDKKGEGFLLAKKEKKWAIINTNGGLLTPFDFDNFYESSSDEVIATKNDKKLKINLDLKSKSILSIEPYVNSNSTEFVGIGVYMSLSGIIEEVIPNSPAELSGIKIYDKIVKIDGIDTAMMTHGQMINAMRGETDTIVRIDILRDEKPMQFKIKRAKLTTCDR